MPTTEHHRRDDGRFYFRLVSAWFVLILVSFTTIAVIALLRDDPSSATASGPAPGTRTATCPAGLRLTGPVADRGSIYVGGPAVTIDAGDSYFDATCAIGLTKGEVTLTVTNKGQILHNLTIPSLDIDENLSVGETYTTTVKLGDAPVSYFCKFHRTSGMVGVLTAA